MSGTVYAVDPGTARSALVIVHAWSHAAAPSESQTVAGWEVENGELLRTLLTVPVGPEAVLVIEQVESYGMAVGREVFETVHWAGRFHQAWAGAGRAVVRLPRRDVKLALCGSARATDANIRAALLDRFGGTAAVGTKKAPGPLYGVKSHQWAALALAVTYQLREALPPV